MFEVFNEMFQELWILKRNKQKHKKTDKISSQNLYEIPFVWDPAKHFTQVNI